MQCHQNYEEQFSEVAFSMLDTLTFHATVSYMKEDITSVIFITKKTCGYFFLTVFIPQYTEAYTNSNWLALFDGSRAVHLKHKTK
jgi:hypothetical protein